MSFLRLLIWELKNRFEEMAALAARRGLEARLRDVGIPANALDLLARDAMNQNRLLMNNPRPVG
jgi:alcohol dehydrogenase class IV